MTKSKGFSGAELSIATESLVRNMLDRNRLTLQTWEAKYGAAGFGGIKRKAGEIQALETVLGFMIQNRK